MSRLHPPTVATAGSRHDAELKIRLTEADMAFLTRLAKDNGLPPAVLARLLIKRGLAATTTTTPVSLHVVHEGRGA